MTFLESVKSFFSKDLGWKAFSLFFAICVWFVVINITNPKEHWPFTVKLTLSGVENLSEYHNVVVKNQQELEGITVSVRIRGNRLALEELNKYKGMITASANLSVIYDFTLNGEVTAPIDISLPHIPGVSGDEFEVVSINPKYAHIMLEDIITEEKTVKVTTHGEAAEGYVVLNPVAEPGSVKLRGPRSKLAEIDAVVVDTALSGETGDVSVTLEPRLLNRDGSEVEGVDCFQDIIDVYIKIVKNKTVPVYASYVGSPPPGYTVTGITWEPAELEIVGGESEVNAFSQVRLTPVNVSGLTETNAMPMDIRNLNILPENVSIRNGTPNIVTVTVSIERETQQTLVFPVSMLSAVLSSRYSYIIQDEEISLAVAGVEGAVRALSLENVKLRINLEGLPPGEHTVPVEVSLPAGITLSGEAPNVSVIIAESAAAEPEGEGGEVEDEGGEGVSDNE